MQRLCFKSRKGGLTVQLVRHVYSRDIQRSRTVTLGSLPIDADPDDFMPDLKLRPGVALSAAEITEVAVWLAMAGDVLAARRRREAANRIEVKVRAQVMADLEAKSGDVLARAARALCEVAEALPGLAAQAKADGLDSWATLRPRYLEVNAAWGRLLKAAQASGVAKKKRAPRPV